jgi:putative transposase
MTLVGIVVSKGCSQRQACRDLDMPRANFHRRKKLVYQGPPLRRTSPPNKVPDVVRKRILEYLHEPEFVDSSPWEIVPHLLDRGEYLGSIRTFYRVLSEHGEIKERRLQARHGKHVAPILEATGPNQVWSWDISRLKGPFQGKWYYLYLMLDLYSRYVVGWMVAEHESARLAQHFIRDTVKRHLKEGEEITIHSDRGSPMTANTTRELLTLLGVSQSLSRPRTSDDNPYSEAQFKTLKYHPTFPGFFESKEAVISHMDQFITWCNNEHMHLGLNLHTPASVQFGHVAEVVLKRQRVLSDAYEKNPERFPNGRPIVKMNPVVVGINLHLKAVNVETILNHPEEKNESSNTLHSPEILH